MRSEKIGIVEAILVILIVRISHLILNVPKSILTSTGSASILNSVYVSFIAIFLSYLIYRLFKRFSSYDLLDVSHFLGGNILKNVVGAIYIAYLLFSSSLIVRSFSESLKLIYFPKSTVSLIILVFIIAVVIINKFGRKTVIKTNSLVVPLIAISILVVFVMSAKDFTVQRALPILGFGFKETFLIGLSNIFTFSGIAYLFFLNPMLKSNKDFKKICLFSISIASVLLILCVMCLLFLFPFITSSEEVLSIYIATRRLEFGRFLQRADAIFILIWMLSILSYLSVCMMFILNIFKKTATTKHATPMVYCFSAILFGVALIANNIPQIRFIENNIYKWSCISVVFILSFFILILANSKKKKQEKNKSVGIGEKT